MQVNYTKMNGLKNDFVVLRGPVEVDSDQVTKLCNRQTGVGADGVLVVTQLESGHIQMGYWNADGSRAEMCGNGLRCIARFAVDNKLVGAGEFTVETAVGPLKVICNNTQDDVEVQVGKVSVEPVPINLQGFTFYKAKVGNPHAITFVDSTTDVSVSTVGPKVEHDDHFPDRTNVEFVEVIDDKHLRLRVWERGVGETLACGTGMVASAVVSSKIKKTALPVVVEVRGGTAQIWMDDEGYVRLLGPVETMLKGQTEI